MMRSILHSVLCMLLALGLAMAGVAQARAGVAMARAEGQTEVVICGENGPHVVVLDANGHRVAKVKGDACGRCPACAMAQAAGDPATPDAAQPATRASLADASNFNTPERAGACGLPAARGPPARG